jgi:hypothetical protein
VAAASLVAAVVAVVVWSIQLSLLHYQRITLFQLEQAVQDQLRDRHKVQMAETQSLPLIRELAAVAVVLGEVRAQVGMASMAVLAAVVLNLLVLVLVDLQHKIVTAELVLVLAVVMVMPQQAQVAAVEEQDQ